MSKLLTAIENQHPGRYHVPRLLQLRPWVLCLSLIFISLIAGPVYAQTTPAPAEVPASANEVAPTINSDPDIDSDPDSKNATDNAGPAAQGAVPLSRVERDNQLLARAAEDEAEWLDTPHGKVLALSRLSENRMTKGAVLLLHTAGVSSGWPASLENLRRNLPQHGWMTLALVLPPEYVASIPARAEIEEPPLATEIPQEDATATATPTEAATSAAPATEPTEQPPAIPRAELISGRIDAAMEFLLANSQQEVILLVDNAGVYESLQHLANSSAKTKDSGPVKALVLINLQPQQPLSKDQLTAIFASPGRPVMDVFLNPDTDQQISIRKRHRAEALRNQLDSYQQLALPPLQIPSVDNTTSFWLERVRGFMEQHAASGDSDSNNPGI